MPLRDHFRSPLDDVHAWDELHGGWPMMIVRELVQVLPEPYFAAPTVHLGTLFEIDVARMASRRKSRTASMPAMGEWLLRPTHRRGRP